MTHVPQELRESAEFAHARVDALRAALAAWPLGSGYGRESTADENVPVSGVRLVESSCFTRCRRQAPTGRHANPTLVGWFG
jgi:hypothetical protein